jgi:RNA polymerase sigma-B factor
MAGHSSQVREELIERYRPLAFMALRNLRHHWDEDLEQVAMLGLIKAIDRYDPATGYCFSSFAVPTILGELRHYLRDQSHLVRCPRPLINLHDAVKARERELTKETGQVPALGEVAASLGVPVDRVAEAMAMEEICRPWSLDAPVPPKEAEQPVTLEDCLGEEDPELTRAEERVAWRQMLERLDPRLKQVIELRFYQNLSQQESARRLGVSQMHVSRLERRALDRLRAQAAAA